jgi:hypothetical protein
LRYHPTRDGCRGPELPETGLDATPGAKTAMNPLSDGDELARPAWISAELRPRSVVDVCVSGIGEHPLTVFACNLVADGVAQWNSS